MLGSLKNFSYVKIPNFAHQKRKNPQNQIMLRLKDALFNGELAYPYFANGLWRETQKVRIRSFHSCIVSSSQVSSDTMLGFYQL